MENTPMDERRKRLLYQSWHRGSKETDELLGPFAREFLPQCHEDELELYEKFAAEDDHDIWHWATGKKNVPEAYADLLERIKTKQGSRYS